MRLASLDMWFGNLAAALRLLNRDREGYRRQCEKMLAKYDANGDGLPNVMDKITFAVSTTATTKPWVTVTCDQDGTQVYKASNGIFATSLNQIFTLGSNSWSSGAASCTAYLQNWSSYSKRGTITNLASMSFSVGA